MQLVSILPFIYALKFQHFDASFPCRSAGNLCLSFSTITCSDVSSNPSIETPQVTIFTKKKHTGYNHLIIILGVTGVALLVVLLCLSLSMFLYTRRKKTEVAYRASKTLGVEFSMEVHYFYSYFNFLLFFFFFFSQLRGRGNRYAQLECSKSFHL